jgi:hypothetical protein
MSEIAKNSLMSFVGRKSTKAVNFMDSKVNINKLTTTHVAAIQEKANEAEKGENHAFDLLLLVLRSAVEGADQLSDDDFRNLPLDELNKLSEAVLAHSGLSGNASS